MQSRRWNIEVGEQRDLAEQDLKALLGEWESVRRRTFGRLLNQFVCSAPSLNQLPGSSGENISPWLIRYLYF